MVAPGISQTLRHYQGNKVMACEKLYIWIVNPNIKWTTPPRRPLTSGFHRTRTRRGTAASSALSPFLPGA